MIMRTNRTIILYSFLLFVLALSTSLHAQFLSTQYNYHVEVTENHTIYQTVRQPQSDTVTIPKGAIITYERKYKIKGQEYTVTVSDTAKSTLNIFASKEVSVPTILPGIATITIDKKDKSRLNLNYYLIKSTKFPTGTMVKMDIDGKKIDSLFLKDEFFDVLEISKGLYNDQKMYLTMHKELDDDLIEIRRNIAIKPERHLINTLQYILRKQDSLWINDKYFLPFRNSTFKIYELNSLGDTTHIYYKKYTNEPYFVKIQNRGCVRFKYRSWESGALTVPFKYRPKSKMHGTEIADDFSADLSVGAYFGYALGKITYTYRTDEERDPTKIQFSFGPFISFSRVEIDSNSTLSAKDRLSTKRAILTLSPGIGMMISIANTRIGLFSGIDIGAGDVSKKWDYNKKIWFGFGIGYNVGLFWQPKDK